MGNQNQYDVLCFIVCPQVVEVSSLVGGDIIAVSVYCREFFSEDLKV